MYLFGSCCCIVAEPGSRPAVLGSQVFFTFPAFVATGVKRDFLKLPSPCQ